MYIDMETGKMITLIVSYLIVYKAKTTPFKHVITIKNDS